MSELAFDSMSNCVICSLHAFHSLTIETRPVYAVRLEPSAELLMPCGVPGCKRHMPAPFELICSDIDVDVIYLKPSMPLLPRSNIPPFPRHINETQVLQPSSQQKDTVTASQIGERLHTVRQVCGGRGFNRRSKLCGKRLKASKLVVGIHFNVRVGECGYAVGICTDRCVARHSRWDALRAARVVAEAGVLAWLVLNGITPASPSPSVRNCSRTLP